MIEILDLVFFTIFVVIILASAKKGIVRTLLEFAAFVLSIVLALQIAGPLSHTIYDTALKGRIEVKIAENLEKSEAPSNAKKAMAIVESLPGFVQSYLEKFDHGAADMEAEIARDDFSGQDAAKLLAEKIARPLCEMVMTGILFVVFAAVLGGLLGWAAAGISKLFKLPIIGTVNKIFGALFGAVKAGVLIYLVVAVLMLIAPKAQADSKLSQAVEQSQVVAYTEQYLPESIFGALI